MHEVKKEIFWDNSRKFWKDWLGNCWYSTSAEVCGEAVVTVGTFTWSPSSIGEDNTYRFRGEINITHLVTDCREDDRLGFIAIGTDFTYMGIIAGALEGVKIPELVDSTTFFKHVDGYMIYQLPKAATPQIVKFLPGAIEAYRQKLRKLGRKIRKQHGKLSGAAETKVMTY